MNVQSATFQTSAPDLASCPEPEFPEFAFIGRSNVGKSSLINTLANQRKPIADVSKTPGRTRLINFFRINEAWHLIDLPGYGFAKVSGKRQDDFRDFVSDYLNNRESLFCVFSLIDCRHSPQKLDLQFTQWLMESEIPFVLVFTKADKVKAGAAKRNIDAFHAEMAKWSDNIPRTFITSSTNGLGRKDILNFIQEAVDSTKA